MAGRYQNNNKAASQSREKIIQSWLLTTATRPGIDRYDDLHVDQIDSLWKPKDRWVEAGFEALKVASALCAHHSIQLSLVLAFSLVDDDSPLGLNFTNSAEFEDNLSLWHPPSLYLMKPGGEFWRQTQHPDITNLTVAEFDCGRIKRGTTGTSCYFLEFMRIGTGEYTRSVFIHQRTRVN